ncbi:MAG: hypothetical protein Q4F41_09020 [Eubacteriales bacterium]|nr:hypothetical protein [Eubacteriales bacterium]
MTLKIIQSIYDDGKEEGILQGITQCIKVLVETLQESGYSKEESTAKLMFKFSFSRKEAKNI